MSNFQKLVSGIPTGTQVQGTDIGSGAATSSQFLAADGASGAAFRSLSSSDLPTITLTSDVTGSASAGSIATTVAKIQGTTVSGVTGNTNVVFSNAPAIQTANITGVTTISDQVLFRNTSDTSRHLALNLVGMSSSTTLTLAPVQSTNQTLTIPNITGADTLATLGLSQTFSGATTFSAAGTALTVTNNANIGGSLGVGVAPSTVNGILIGNTALTGNFQRGAYANFTTSSAATSGFTGFETNVTQASGITTTNGIGFYCFSITPGSGSTLTRSVDFSSSSASTHPATNNASLADNLTFTGNYFLNQSSTDANSLGGALTLTASGTALTVTNTASIGTLSLGSALAVGSGGTGTTASTGTGSVVLSSAPAITGAWTLTDAGTIINATTATKVLAFNLAGMTAARTLTLSSSQSTSQTLTIPNITGADTLATLGLAQTFSAATTFSAAGTALAVTNNATVGGTLALTSSGSAQLSVGGNIGTTSKIFLTGTDTAITGTTAIGYRSSWTSNSNNTAKVASFVAGPTTAASTTVSHVAGFEADGFTLGASGTVTRSTDFFSNGASNHTATNNAAISDNATYTGNFFINQSGTDASSFGGDVTLAGSSTGLAVTNNATVGGTLALTSSSSAQMSLGSGISASVKLSVAGSDTAITGGSAVGIKSAWTSNSNNTSNVVAFNSNPTTAASTTVAHAIGFEADGFTLGASGTITRLVDYFTGGASNHTATNNAAISDNLTFSGNFFISQTGTDPSSFGGNVTVAGSITGGYTDDTTTTGTVNSYSVTSKHYVEFDAATTITLNGFANGVAGQILYVTNNTGNTFTVTHNSGSGTQPIQCPGGTNFSISSRGGAVFACTGGSWFIMSK
jgi:hypothetical protein